MMKVLYWIGCVFVAAILATLLRYIGISGALLMVLCEGSAFYLATRLCKNYDRKHNQGEEEEKEECPKVWICPQCQTENSECLIFCNICGAERPEKAIRQEQPNIELDTTKADKLSDFQSSTGTIDSQPDIDGQPLKIAFCRKCGHELHNDSKFCSYCGAELWRGNE